MIWNPGFEGPAYIDIINVGYCHYETLPEKDYVDDGYNSLEEMMKDLRQYCLKISLKDHATPIKLAHVRGILVPK